MKRRALLSTFIVMQALLWCLATTSLVARADDCPNKWNEPKEVKGEGPHRADAVADFEKKSKTLADDANCKSNKCAEGKGKCRPLRTATQSCSGDDEKGWTCTGMVRVGCFCLDPKEKGRLAPTPAPGSAPTPAESASACDNKFGDPKEAIGATDTSNQMAALAGLVKKVNEYKDEAAKVCAAQKCTGEKKCCRMYYTTTGEDCTESKDKNFPGWACKTKFRSGCFCLGTDEETLAMASEGALPAGEEYAAHRPFRGKTMLVGVVLAEGCVPNETCTASLVANPDTLAGTPGIVVEKVRVPEHRNSRGHATLQGEVVASDQAKRQPADGPITFITPETGAATALALDVALADNPDEPVSVPIEELPPSRRKHHEEASAPPMIPDNGVCVVHDKYSGDGHATRVRVNGTDVAVLAESPEMTVFRPGDAANAGENKFTVTDSGVTKTYRLSSPTVSITAGQTTLQQDQSTQFQVTVADLVGIPDSSWSSSGEPDGGEGYVLLTVKNDSPDTTTVSGGNLIKVKIHKSDIAGGTYTYSGSITAQQPGPFQLEATIDGRLAQAAPIDVGDERFNLGRGAEKGCCQYNNPASGNWCAIETQTECLGSWKGPNYGCNQSGTCGLNIPLGGN
jgi:hypothetical protein